MIIMNLVFFAFAGCSEQSNNGKVAIKWEGQRATGIAIPRGMLKGFEKDSVGSWLKVKWRNADVNMLGNYSIENDSVVFTPLIAFTPELLYEVRWRNQLLTQISIPRNEYAEPVVRGIFPTANVWPENVLKIYIIFSKPMQEGHALENIVVLKNGDTIPNIFLDLQPELWNNDRTILTLWLDPGRVKRELQPNKQLGTPLEKGSHYFIIIKRNWNDAEGIPLSYDFRTDFKVGERDDVSPDPGKWTIPSPAAGTVDTLRIALHESLDRQLLINAVHIVDSDGNELKGKITPFLEETILIFVPETPWRAGEYTLEIEPRLEDLAGNNLERLFDRDLLKDSTERKTGIYKRKFSIK